MVKTTTTTTKKARTDYGRDSKDVMTTFKSEIETMMWEMTMTEKTGKTDDDGHCSKLRDYQMRLGKVNDDVCPDCGLFS